MSTVSAYKWFARNMKPHASGFKLISRCEDISVWSWTIGHQAVLLHLLLKPLVLVPGWDQRCEPEYGNTWLPKIATKMGIFGGNNQPHIMEENCTNPSTISYTLFNETSSPAACWLGKQSSSSLPTLLSLPALSSTGALQLSQWSKQWSLKTPSSFASFFEDGFQPGSIGWWAWGDGETS